MEESLNAIEMLNELLDLLENGEVTEEMARELLNLF
jgi:hypothetical protein